MAITNPFSITYGSRQVGGSTDYQLHGPYVLDKSFDRLRLVFDVVVVAVSFADLQSKSDTLETDFRLRDQSLTIDLDGSTWTFTRGTHILAVTSSIVKSGNPDTDKGYSRAYTITIEAELPADDEQGLRDVEVLVDVDASRRKTVTMRGTYTALSGTDAVAQYPRLRSSSCKRTTARTAIRRAGRSPRTCATSLANTSSFWRASRKRRSTIPTFATTGSYSRTSPSTPGIAMTTYFGSAG
jgi:hypothetical protein